MGLVSVAVFHNRFLRELLAYVTEFAAAVRVVQCNKI